MKKSIILIVLILGIIAILPTIGNSIIKQTIDEKVLELGNFGIKIEVDNSSSSYLSTSRHFEFLVTDSRDFFKHLNINSNASFDGMLIGIDIKYYNLPFVKAVNLEIYPLKMSTDIRQSIKEGDIRLYRYLEAFFKLKRVLCHINYNFINNKFDGYLNDIDEKLELKDKSTVKFKILKVFFDGKPNISNFSTKELSLNINQKDRNITVMINSFKSSSEFNLKNGYKNRIGFKDIKVISTTAIKSIDFDIKDLNFNTSVKGLDTKEIENLRALILKGNSISYSKFQNEMKISLVSLFSRGLTISLNDYSFKNIILNKIHNINGASLKAKIIVKKDTALAQKLSISPMLVLNDFDISLNIKLSKEIFEKLKSVNSNILIIDSYAKINKNNVTFDIVYKDTKLLINGKALN